MMMMVMTMLVSKVTLMICDGDLFFVDDDDDNNDDDDDDDDKYQVKERF
jgi:hypothetical protein